VGQAGGRRGSRCVNLALRDSPRVDTRLGAGRLRTPDNLDLRPNAHHRAAQRRDQFGHRGNFVPTTVLAARDAELAPDAIAVGILRADEVSPVVEKIVNDAASKLASRCRVRVSTSTGDAVGGRGGAAARFARVRRCGRVRGAAGARGTPEARPTGAAPTAGSQPGWRVGRPAGVGGGYLGGRSARSSAMRSATPVSRSAP